MPKMKFGIDEEKYKHTAKDRVFLLLVDKLRMVLSDVVDYNYILEHVKWI